jgi:two-component system phosphate regulon sensor histidine kinase PhoR
MTSRSWKFHSGRLLAGILLTLLAGWMLGHTVDFLAAGAGAFAAWQMFNLWRLHDWLKRPERELPEGYGIWADIFGSLRNLVQNRLQQESNYKTMIAEFQSLTNALPDAILIVDSDNDITWCNDTAVTLLALRIPEDLGQAVTNLLRGPDFAQWLAAEDRPKRRLEMPSPRNDNRWWHVTAVPFQQDQCLIVIRDITELHNVEQVRRDFVANISHELRTPVTVFLGYLELLQNHAEPEVASAVERMQTQARNMKSLLDDLLELSRLQSDEIQGEIQEIDIPAMIEQLKEQAEEISAGKHSLEFDVQPGLRITGVASDLESAFRNLIINAIRYTPERGKITVSWRDSPDGPCLAVEDTGIGIPKRDLPRLTERFYRVGSGRDRQSGGTGLGLAIVKHVLNAHKANLIIRSELGEGSEFICQFPPERKISAQISLPI